MSKPASFAILKKIDLKKSCIIYLKFHWINDRIGKMILKVRLTWHKWWIQPWPHHTREHCCVARTGTYRRRQIKVLMRGRYLSGSTTRLVLPSFSWHTLANRACLASCSSSQVTQDDPNQCLASCSSSQDDPNLMFFVQAKIGIWVQCLLKWR